VNYYERHLGDYAKDTGHLSLLEHGVYTLLLDRYYATEQGIPADQAHRLARARTADERAAVDAVLADFFVLVDGVWINHRVGEELAKANARINAARENGKKGGSPKKKAGYNERGHLYAIQRVDGGPVKVGITKHPAPRMSDLRGKVGPINILAMIEVGDMGACEAAVHQHYSNVLDGEWISAEAEEIVATCHRVSQGLGSEQPANLGAGSQTHQAPPIHLSNQKQKQERASPTGSRLSADWVPSESEIEFAINERPDVDWRKEAAKFRDYWAGKAGKDGRKADWSATWRNWIRRADARPGSRAGPLLTGVIPTASPPSKTLSAIQTLQGMKHGNRVDPQRDFGRPEPVALLEPGPDPGGGHDRWNGDGVVSGGY